MGCTELHGSWTSPEEMQRCRKWTKLPHFTVSNLKVPAAGYLSGSEIFLKSVLSLTTRIS